MKVPMAQPDRRDDFDPPPQSPAERAARLYAEALATHRLALEVHARCYRRRLLTRSTHASPEPLTAAPPVSVKASAAQPEITADQLTPRQREVVRLISRGCTNAEIADLLVVTRGTAANHVAAILTRLGVTNRTQVATWAMAAGLIER